MIGLMQILVHEGQARGDWEKISVEVRQAATDIGYLRPLELVVKGYQPAAGLRQVVDGRNVSEKSLAMFRQFAADCEASAQDENLPLVIRALCHHNKASALARHNGDQSEEQTRHNIEALGLLRQTFDFEQDDDWYQVFAKVVVGLFESESVSFVETEYKAIVEWMLGRCTKDAAGRVEFYAAWLEGQGRIDEAVAWLRRLKELGDEDASAPEQRERALGLLSRLVASLSTAIPVVLAVMTVWHMVSRTCSPG